ncbi:MAG: epoxide hydrolase, partial [Myxococcota bacterium]
GAAFFPRDYAPPSLEGAERVYSDIRRWTIFESGGHFAAMERPDELVRELRELFRPLRDT